MHCAHLPRSICSLCFTTFAGVSTASFRTVAKTPEECVRSGCYKAVALSTSFTLLQLLRKDQAGAPAVATAAGWCPSRLAPSSPFSHSYAALEGQQHMISCIKSHQQDTLCRVIKQQMGEVPA